MLDPRLDVLINTQSRLSEIARLRSRKTHRRTLSFDDVNSVINHEIAKVQIELESIARREAAQRLPTQE